MKAFISLADPFKKTRWVVGLVSLILPLLLSAQQANRPLAPRGAERLEESPVRRPVSATPSQSVLSFPAGPKAAYVPGQVLVRFRSGTPEEWAQIAHGVVRAKVLREYSTLEGLQLVRLPADLPVEEAVKLYRRQPEVLYAEPDYIRYAILEPNDPRFTDGTQWAMKNTGQSGGTPGADIDAVLAWDTTQGSSSVEVVVIDTGIDFNHPDLQANVDQGLSRDCVSGSCQPGGADDVDHGTHVAGTIGAVGNNAMGVVGVNWAIKLIACKFLTSTGGSDSDAIACLDYVAGLKQSGRNIVATNNSWGGGGFSQSLSDAIDVQRQLGILFIAAAGNENVENDASPHFPSNYFLPNVISVASTDRNDLRSGFSNFGRRSVHLGAPGSAIISTTPSNTYSIFSGTSMATPHVAGVAALLKAADGSRDWRAIKNLILAGGDSTSAMNGTTVTGKRLNAKGALNCSNQVVLERVFPVPDDPIGQIGEPLTLAALHINCANPNGDVQVTVNPGGQSITLMDNGSAPDMAAGDGIYSGAFTPSAAGTFTLSFQGGGTVTLHVPSANYQISSTSFVYRNISGASLNLEDDSARRVLSPFPIAFAGGSFNSVIVGSNGVVAFGDGFNPALNVPFPVANAAGIVALWSDDLLPIPNSSRNVFSEVLGASPNRELVIEWRNVDHFNCSANRPVRFQAVFFEGKSDILFNYLDTFFDSSCSSLNNGSSATVGIQVTEELFQPFSFNSASLSDNLALLWTAPQNAVPSISLLSPSSLPVGSADFTLTVTGSGFIPDSVVSWDGSDRTTTFINASQLQADIPASDLVDAGAAPVTVFTPAPGGGTSNAVNFTILSPVITGMVPGTIPATSPGFELTLNGSNFHTGSVVRWNGMNRTTMFVSPTQLQADIPDTDVAAVGIAQVTVLNSAGTGGVSNGATFTINFRNPLPTITGLSPAGVLEDGPAFTLTVFGSNFVFNSTVQLNGSDRTTTFIGGGQLQASILAGDITTMGTKNITVVSPGPGGGTSNTASFPVQVTPNAVPSTSGLVPNIAVAGSVRDTLAVRVNGSNFVPGSVVRWNGSNRLTTFFNGNRVDATIPASDLVGAGTAQVTVFTPVPGGGTSNAQTFTINNPTAVISSLSPNSTAEDGLEFTLTVIGSNFVPGAVVRWAGSNRTTTFVGSSQLRAIIPASDIANPGMFTITVVNPGAAASNSVNFTVN